MEQAIELLELLKRRDVEVIFLKAENRRPSGMMKKMGTKVVANTEPKSRKDAVTEFFDSPNGTDVPGLMLGVIKQ